MNIEKRLRALRQARKLRPILPFHAFSITGIDVPSDKYHEIQAIIKQLFKALKCQSFDIQINHWGEIHTIEPKTGIRVTIEVCTCPKREVTYPLLKSISDDHYLSLTHNEDLLPILRLRYRALAPNGTVKRW